jgi:molybdopterin/thiamine biosynthesis adenylyltransferase/rhodanese-related sulfurtransferase
MSLLLTADELTRYSPQLKLAQVGLAGQLKLKNARVLCIGAGGLGSSLLLYLAAAGIGTLGIVDDDCVELSNLQRQILYQQAHLGHKKARMAKQQLTALNPAVNIQVYTEKFNFNNAEKIISQYDIIADCSDNFPTKYLINDMAFYLNKPYVFASVDQFAGQCAFFLGKQSACFRCLFPVIPAAGVFPACDQSGVLGILPGILGTLQAAEIIKWILGLAMSLAENLLTLDVLTMKFSKLHFQQNSTCVLCVQHSSLEALLLSPACIDPPDMTQYAISCAEMESQLQAGKDILLLDVRTAQEHSEYNLGGILIPLPELSQQLKKLNPQQFIIVYCQSGSRSKQAVTILNNANFSTVRYLQGGIFNKIK